MAAHYVSVEGAQGVLTLMVTPQQSALLKEGNYRTELIKMLDTMSSNGELTKHYENAQRNAWDCIPPPHRSSRVKQHHHTAVKLIEAYDNDSQISQFLLQFVKKCSSHSCPGNVFLKFMELVVVDLHTQLCQNPNVYDSIYSSLAPNTDVLNLTELDISNFRCTQGDDSQATNSSSRSASSTDSTSSAQDGASQEAENPDDMQFHWTHAATTLLLTLFLERKDELKKIGSRTSFWRTLAAMVFFFGYFSCW